MSQPCSVANWPRGKQRPYILNKKPKTSRLQEKIRRESVLVLLLQIINICISDNGSVVFLIIDLFKKFGDSEQKSESLVLAFYINKNRGPESGGLVLFC